MNKTYVVYNSNSDDDEMCHGCGAYEDKILKDGKWQYVITHKDDCIFEKAENLLEKYFNETE
jgi:hypothetical protein